jgi:hypothetical protein
MEKKILAVFLMLGLLATVSFAQTTTLFSFEDQQPGFDMSATDGYMFVSASDPDYGSAVTDGNWAMAVDVKDGWTQGLQGGIGFGWDWTPYFPALSDAANAGGKLLIDVTTNNTLANVPMSSGIQLALFIQGESAADPGSFNYTISYQLINSVYYNQYGDTPTMSTSTLEFDLTQDTNGNPTWFPSTWTTADGGWADMRLNTNVIGGATNAGIIIIDNIRVEAGIPGTILGDFNGDGTVDIADYTVWADNFNGSDSVFPAGSSNADGTVDLADYTTWADNFGNTAPVSVPEPATMTLLGLGAVALIRRK